MQLTGADKRALRALGNPLKPVVFVGKEGVTPSVLTAITEAHAGAELIKLRVLDNCATPRKQVALELDAASESSLVQILGRTILLYRRHPEKPVLSIPSAPVSKQG